MAKQWAFREGKPLFSVGGAPQFGDPASECCPCPQCVCDRAVQLQMTVAGLATGLSGDPYTCDYAALNDDYFIDRDLICRWRDNESYGCTCNVNLFSPGNFTRLDKTVDLSAAPGGFVAVTAILRLHNGTGDGSWPSDAHDFVEVRWQRVIEDPRIDCVEALHGLDLPFQVVNSRNFFGSATYDNCIAAASSTATLYVP